MGTGQARVGLSTGIAGPKMQAQAIGFDSRGTPGHQRWADGLAPANDPGNPAGPCVQNVFPSEEYGEAQLEGMVDW